MLACFDLIKVSYNDVKCEFDWLWKNVEPICNMNFSKFNFIIRKVY